jgi:hypothetical protein
MEQTTPAAAHTPTGGRYDVNIVRLIADYPDFVITGTAAGYEARTRVSGRARGPAITATSLDELAERMDACRRREDGV